MFSDNIHSMVLCCPSQYHWTSSSQKEMWTASAGRDFPAGCCHSWGCANLNLRGRCGGFSFWTAVGSHHGNFAWVLRTRVRDWKAVSCLMPSPNSCRTGGFLECAKREWEVGAPHVEGYNQLVLREGWMFLNSMPIGPLACRKDEESLCSALK